MSVDISVIIPIYQAEKYLRRCLESLISQTFTDFEMVLIDDGSNDGSGIICEEYKKRDSRIRVIHKKNEGVSKSRQIGLDVSEGRYIIYVDPDDWVEENYLEALYEEAIGTNADMTICDFYAEYTSQTIYCSQKPTKLNARTVMEEFFPKHNGCTWNKLLKRELFERFNICFPQNICFCEDLYVNCSLLKNEIKISYVPLALYHYDQIVNENSLVRHYSEKTYEHDMKLLSLFIKLFSDSREPMNMRKTFARNLTERAFWSGLYNSNDFYKKFGIFSDYLKKENDIKGYLYYLSSIGLYKPTYVAVLFYKGLKRKLLYIFGKCMR